MLQFDFAGLMAQAVGDVDGLTQSDLDAIAKLTPTAHAKFEEWRSSKDAIFYDIVFDGAIASGIDDKAREISNRFKNIVVLGIGGSALGLRCMSQALLPPFWNLQNDSARGKKPKLFVCDNIDPEGFDGLLNLIELSDTCFIVISKSGKTTETAAQFFIVLSRLQKLIGESWRDHLIIITDPKSGELRPFAEKEKLATFPIHPKLGGRFSALSAVGLFPAACVGIDTSALLNGAKEMAKRCASSDLNNNPAYRIGAYHYWMDVKKRKPTSVMMPYSDALNLFSDWYAQLWAESLGKEGKGPTPIKALGATDQHSQVQLYMEGPKDKVFTFVGVDKFRVSENATRVDDPSSFFDYLKGHDLGSILHAEQRATAAALQNTGRPNLTITLPSIDAHHIGELFMCYEIATAFAGALYKINPFDQPGVELGKKLTREFLLKQSLKS